MGMFKPIVSKIIIDSQIQSRTSEGSSSFNSFVRVRCRHHYGYDYEAGSAYRMHPYIRSNARSVENTLFGFRRSARSPCAAVRSARRPHLAAVSPGILKIIVTRDEPPFIVNYALQPPSPRARHVVYARDGAGNSRSRCAFTSRILGSTDLGQLRRSVILVSKTNCTSFRNASVKKVGGVSQLRTLNELPQNRQGLLNWTG